MQQSPKHLKAIFAEGELAADSVVNHWLITAADGKNYRVTHYSLDAILNVGYRVRSQHGTQFFQFIQYKLHFAVTGKTAAELIAQRADSTAPNMGLTTWKSGRVQKAEQAAKALPKPGKKP